MDTVTLIRSALRGLLGVVDDNASRPTRSARSEHS